jgi:enoyl-CoA hydratase/carnithine racemase
MIEMTIGDRLVATATVGNPGQRNALGPAGWHQLAAAIERASATGALRVVILIDAGR